MEDLEDVPEVLHSEEQDRRMDGQTDKCKQQSKREVNHPVYFQLCFCNIYCIYMHVHVMVKLNQINKDKYPNIHGKSCVGFLMCSAIKKILTYTSDCSLS